MLWLCKGLKSQWELRQKARPCGPGPEYRGKERITIWSGPRYPELTPGIPDSEFMAKQLFFGPPHTSVKPGFSQNACFGSGSRWDFLQVEKHSWKGRGKMALTDSRNAASLSVVLIWSALLVKSTWEQLHGQRVGSEMKQYFFGLDNSRGYTETCKSPAKGFMSMCPPLKKAKEKKNIECRILCVFLNSIFWSKICPQCLEDDQVAGSYSRSCISLVESEIRLDSAG